MDWVACRLRVGVVEDHIHALIELKPTHRISEHHRKQSFVEELKELLEKHGFQYDPKYLL